MDAIPLLLLVIAAGWIVNKVFGNVNPFIRRFLVLGVAIGLIWLLGSLDSLTTSPTPTRVPTLIPTRTPKPVQFQNSTVPTRFPCSHWNQITPAMNGKTVCVYGVVQELYSTNESWTRLTFSNEPNTFFMHSALYVFPDLQAGTCIRANGVVQTYGEIPFIETDDLYFCEDWMQ